jgi:hypothetical protein
MNEDLERYFGATHSYTSSWRKVAKVSHHATLSQVVIWLRVV